MKWGDAGQYQRDEKPREHDPCDLGSKLLLGDASDRLIGGYDALSPQRSLDHLSQRPERVDDQPCSGPNEEETEGGFNSSTGDLADGFAHSCQSDGRNDADEEGGHAEDLVYEELDDGQGDVHEASLRG